MERFRITDANIDEASLGNIDSVYVIVWGRYDDDEAEYVKNEDDDAGAIRQLRAELQEACDAGHIAGNFNILARGRPVMQEDEDGSGWVTAKEAMAREVAEAGPRFNVYCHGPDGTVMHHDFVKHDAYDAKTNLLLTSDEALVFCAQIIDHGHDWGEHPDDCDDLRHLVEHGIKAKTDFSFYVPDGWRVTVCIPMDQENPLPPESEVPAVPNLDYPDEERTTRTMIVEVPSVSTRNVREVGQAVDVVYEYPAGDDVHLEGRVIDVR